MAQGEIEIGDAIACQERETDQCGVLHVEADQIWVEFIGFGKRPSVNADAPIYLHTAKGWIVSLFDNIDFSSTRPFWRRGEVGLIYRQRIVSNFVLAGETAWQADDRVQSASFRLTPDCDFLWPNDRASEIAEMSVDAIPDRTIFTMSVDGETVSLDFALQDDPIRNKWTPSSVGFTLRFGSGIAPLECLERIEYLQSLFALLSWRDLRNEKVSFRRINVEQSSYSHRVITPEIKDAVNRQEARAARPIAVCADNEVERETLQEVLRVWLNRQDQWQEAAGLMRGALRRFNHVSAEQALDACRWHEAIERTKGKAVRPPGMDKVVDAAIAKARECRLDEYVDWIKGCLSGVKGESRNSLFPRLARELNERLGHSFFDDVGVEMIKGAYRARHVTGHGAMGNISKPKIRELWGNVLAMEALCAAQTIADLPLSENGRKQLSIHPLFAAYMQLRKERQERLQVTE